MIIKLKMAKSFSGQLNYILREGSKQLFSNAVRYSPEDINTDMEFLRKFNNHIDFPSMHIIISFDKTDDAKLDENTLITIGRSVVTQLGATENHQYVAAQHFDGGSPHLHICLNRVGPDGKALSNAYSHIRLNKIRIRLEKEYPHLKIASEKNLDLTNQLNLRGADKIKYKIFTAVKNEIGACNNISELLDKLEKVYNIKNELKVGNDGNLQIQGVRFNSEGVWLKGSAVDKMCSYINLVKHFELKSSLQITNIVAGEHNLLMPGDSSELKTLLPIHDFKEINNFELQTTLQITNVVTGENNLLMLGDIFELKPLLPIHDIKGINNSELQSALQITNLVAGENNLLIPGDSFELKTPLPIHNFKEISNDATEQPIKTFAMQKGEIQLAIKLEIENSKNINELIERLEKNYRIFTELKFKRGSDNEVQGIRFKLGEEGEWLKGSEVHRDYSFSKIESQILLITSNNENPLENAQLLNPDIVEKFIVSITKTNEGKDVTATEQPIISKPTEETPSLDKNINIKLKIQDAIKIEIVDCRNIVELITRLEKNYNIKTELKYFGDSIKNVQGISFKMNDNWFKGSEIDRLCSYKNLEKQFQQNKKNIEIEKNYENLKEKTETQLLLPERTEDSNFKGDEKIHIQNVQKFIDPNEIRAEIQTVVLKEIILCNSIQEFIQKLEEVYHIKTEISNELDNFSERPEIVFSKDNVSINLSDMAYFEPNNIPKESLNEDDELYTQDSEDFETDNLDDYTGLTTYANNNDIMKYLKRMLISNGSPKAPTMRNNGTDESFMKKKKRRIRR